MDSLRSALLSRYVELGEECLVSDLSSDEADHIRDSLCRTLYARLFTYLVSRINESLKVWNAQLHPHHYNLLMQVTAHRKPHVLGILDMYGFEAFQQNGFEQFLINYANEKLQQMFIEMCFKVEQEEYLTEGVEWSQVGYFSNSVICQLVDSVTPSRGIFSLLDDMSETGSKSNNGANLSQHNLDQQFLDEMNLILESHPHYEPSTKEDEKEKQNPVPLHSFRYLF